MATAQQSGQALMTQIVGVGGRPGRKYDFVVSGNPLSIAGFPGAIQASFLGAGYAITDLAAGLAYAVSESWLSIGNGSNNCQEYVLETAGWTAGGGTAPTLAASGQQLLNLVFETNPTPNSTVCSAQAMLSTFVGTVGGNTFEPEDMIPAIGYAYSQGWLRPYGPPLASFGLSFVLTAAGAAAAT